MTNVYACRSEPPHAASQNARTLRMPSPETCAGLCRQISNHAPFRNADRTHTDERNPDVLHRDPEGDDKVPTEHCGLPFESYAEDPYRMRELCDAELCCSYVGGQRAPGFVDIHISDQAHCAFLADGQPFVDYIGASENLTQAWRDIVAGVNNNAGSVFEARDPENPNGTGNTTAGGVAHTCTSEVVLKRYTAAELYGIASHYALDVVRFGYI